MSTTLSRVPTPVSTSLLPADLEMLRSDIPVLDSLPVRGFPQVRSADRRLRTVQHIYERTGVLAHIGFAPDDGYALCDKTSPPAVHESMLISAGRTHRPGLADHSPAFGRPWAWWPPPSPSTAPPVAYPRPCPSATTRTPWTVPRFKGERRFHAHLVGRTAAEHATAADQMVPAGDLGPVRRRRIAEEASVLGALLAADCIDADALRVLRPVPALSTPASTCASVFHVPGGWEAFTGEGLREDLLYVHRKLRRIYEEIARACLSGSSGMWQRPAVNAAAAHEVKLPLSVRSRDALGHYLAALRPDRLPAPDHLQDEAERLPHRRGVTLVSVLGNLLGLRRGESQTAAARPSLQLRRMSSPRHGPGRERRTQPRCPRGSLHHWYRSGRRPERESAETSWSRPEDPPPVPAARPEGGGQVAKSRSSGQKRETVDKPKRSCFGDVTDHPVRIGQDC